MRYLCLYKPGQESTGAPTQQEMDAMGAWTKRFLTVAGRGESEIRQLHEIGA